ncbi:MAG: L-serine ammonia-lyase, iron-sulfur-dependent, subunit alpha [Candidatus Bathyarchaeia archaeon]|jgi:L-cysteine desulfidase
MDLDTFFSNEVKPALGCTEPGAVALATSTGAKYIGGKPDRISLKLSANIYKNGVNVGVPNTGGLKGNSLAAALGAIAGDPSKGLQSLAKVKTNDMREAERLVSAGAVTVEIVDDVPNVYIEATLNQGNQVAAVIISERHDNIVEIRVNGASVLRVEQVHSSSSPDLDYEKELLSYNMESLWRIAGDLTHAQELLMLEGADMNMSAALEGVKTPWGCGVGYHFGRLFAEDDILGRVKTMAGAATDFRMGGGPRPIMSSSGSGNHGITAILPVVVVSKSLGKNDRELAEALALSHIVTRYIKAYTGIITPTCGCSIAAGAGATAAIVRLMGGTPKQAEVAVASLIASVMGMVCDGGKGSCALKVSTAAGEAYTSALLAISGGGVTDTQGLIKPDLKNIAETLGILNKEGFRNLDTLILDVMRRQN